MSITISIILLMLCASGIGIWFGCKIGITTISPEDLEAIQQKAFEEAKREYAKFFHNNFDPKGKALLNQYVKAILEENKSLIALNKELNKELQDWRRKK